MPVRKFRHVEQMNQPHGREPGDPDLYRTIARDARGEPASAPPAVRHGKHRHAG